MRALLTAPIKHIQSHAHIILHFLIFETFVSVPRLHHVFPTHATLPSQTVYDSFKRAKLSPSKGPSVHSIYASVQNLFSSLPT